MVKKIDFSSCFNTVENWILWRLIMTSTVSLIFLRFRTWIKFYLDCFHLSNKIFILGQSRWHNIPLVPNSISLNVFNYTVDLVYLLIIIILRSLDIFNHLYFFKWLIIDFGRLGGRLFHCLKIWFLIAYFFCNFFLSNFIKLIVLILFQFYR